MIKNHHPLSQVIRQKRWVLCLVLIVTLAPSDAVGAYLKLFYHSEKDCNEVWLDFYDKVNLQLKETLIRPDMTVFAPGKLGTGHEYFQSVLLEVKPLYDLFTREPILYWMEWVEQKTEFPKGNPIYYPDPTESEAFNLTQNHLGDGYVLVKESVLLFGRNTFPYGRSEQIYRKDGKLWEYWPNTYHLVGEIDPAGTYYYDAYEYQRLLNALPIEEPTLKPLPILLYLPEPPPDEHTAVPWILTLEIPTATYNEGLYGVWDAGVFVPLVGSYAASSIAVIPTIIDVTEPVPLDALVDAGYFDPTQTFRGPVYLDGLRIPGCRISPLVRVVPEPATLALVELALVLLATGQRRRKGGSTM